MRFEVWTRGKDHEGLVLFPAMNPENEQELIRKGFRVCHVFEAPDGKRAKSIMADWMMERSGLGDPHTKWLMENRLHQVKISVDDDCKRAIEKHRNRAPDQWGRDREYINALEDENADLLSARKKGSCACDEEGRTVCPTVAKLETRYNVARAEAPSGMGALEVLRRELNTGDDETCLDSVRKLKDRTMALIDRNAQWAELSESLGWYDPHEVKALVDMLKRSAALALDAIERGQKVIEALMPGLRHIAVQNYQEVNEAPMAMADAVDALREALGLQLPENVSEEATESRPKES